jgi:hypothetical protein
MLGLYQALTQLALQEFAATVRGATFIGGTAASPNNLRLPLVDTSFVDIWLSSDGDYAYHWEHRRQSGRLYRWDNAPHHSQIATFPHHFHEGDEQTVVESHLAINPEDALREVLTFLKCIAPESVASATPILAKSFKRT